MARQVLPVLSASLVPGRRPGGGSSRTAAAGDPRPVAGFNEVLFIGKNGGAFAITGIFNTMSEDFRAANPQAVEMSLPLLSQGPRPGLLKKP